MTITLMRATTVSASSGRLIGYGVPVAHVPVEVAEARLASLLGDGRLARRCMLALFDGKEWT